MSADGIYTIEIDRELERLFLAGLSPDQIAARLGKRPGSVRWRINFLQLDTMTTACSDPAVIGSENARAACRVGDARFKQAMLRAIRLGREKAPIGVAKDRRALTPPRHVFAGPAHGYGASALASVVSERRSHHHKEENHDHR